MQTSRSFPVFIGVFAAIAFSQGAMGSPRLPSAPPIPSAPGARVERSNTDGPVRKARFKTTIMKEWQERVGDAFEDKDEIVCVKEGTFNVYDQRGKDDFHHVVGGEVTCPAQHRGRRLSATVAGLIVISDEELPGGAKRDLKMVSPMLSVSEEGFAVKAPEAKLQDVISSYLGTYDLEARSFVTFLQPEDWRDCTAPGGTADCESRFPVSFSAYVEIEDAP